MRWSMLAIAAAGSAAVLIVGGCSSGDDPTAAGTPSTSRPTSTSATTQPSQSATPSHTTTPSSTASASERFGGWSKQGIRAALVDETAVHGLSGYAPGGEPKVAVNERQDARIPDAESKKCISEAKALAAASTTFLSATASYTTGGDVPLPSVTETVTGWPNAHVMNVVARKGNALDTCLGRRGKTRERQVHGVTVVLRLNGSIPSGWQTARFTVGNATGTLLCDAADAAEGRACNAAIPLAVDKLKHTSPH